MCSSDLTPLWFSNVMASDNASAVAGSLMPGQMMKGRRGLIMGVANDHSIAWGIARTVAAHGARLAFTFQGEAQEKRVRPLASSVNSSLVYPCDVENDGELEAVFAGLQREWGGLDFLVHAIAHSDRNELKGRYVETTRGNFLRTDRKSTRLNSSH